MKLMANFNRIPYIVIDTGLRNIINKLAEFVARNGPEFESITKDKQRNNPKFEFLFGGEYYQYYQWRVSSEQTSKTQSKTQTNQQFGCISLYILYLFVGRGFPVTSCLLKFFHLYFISFFISPYNNLPNTLYHFINIETILLSLLTVLKQQGSITQAQISQLSPGIGNMGGNMPSSGGNTGGGGNNIVLGNNSNQMWLNGPGLNHSGGVGPSGASAGGGPINPAVISAQIEAINVQQGTLRDQILQSEQNLSAQHGVRLNKKNSIGNLFDYLYFASQVLLQQQQSQIDESILKAQHDSLMIQAEEQGVRVAEFEGILQPIVDSCTKDSISTGMH